MKTGHLVRSQEAFGAFRRMLLTLCFFFVCGSALGFTLGGMTDDQDDLLLKEYIVQYATVIAQNEDETASVLSVLGVYLRYPLAAFCFALSSAGILLVPMTLLLQGFGIAFSAVCFTAALGRKGLLLALIAFGSRTLFVLPVTLLLGADAVLRALHFRKAAHGKRLHHKSAAHALKLIGCMLWLLVGTAVELWVIPKLLNLALAGLS